MASCQNYSQNSAFTDGQGSNSTAACPLGGCIDKTPNNDLISLQVRNSNSSELVPGQRKLDVAGLCNISTYKHGDIDVLILYASTNQPVLTGSSLVVGTLTDPSFTDGRARCVNGKFQFTAQVDNLTINTNYKMRLKLSAYNTESQKYSAALDSEFSFFKR